MPFDFHVNDGEFVVLLGNSGSGKTTLLKKLAGLEKTTCESVSINGSVSMMFQNPEFQLFEQTVINDVMYGPKNKGMTNDEAKFAAESALKTVGVEELLFKASPKKLSGGQKRKVALAGILAMNSSALLLDEPTMGLDTRSAIDVMKVLHELNKKGVTIVVALHRYEYVEDYATRVVVMDNGNKVMEGKPEMLVREYDKVAQYGIDIPDIFKISNLLFKEGLIKEDSLMKAEDIIKSLLLCKHSL